MVDELEELRNKTQSGDRLSDPGDSPDEPSEFQEDFVRYFGKSNQSTDGKQVSTSDPLVWAAIKALEDNDERREELRQKAGIEEKRDSRSQLLAPLVKVGLREIDPELAEEIQEGVALQAKEEF